MQNEDIVIWGTGRFAELAYDYYRDICNVLFFVDSRSDRWGQQFCGKEIKNPEILMVRNEKIILAFQSGKELVRKKLVEEYKIHNIVEFGVEEKKCVQNTDDKDQLHEDDIIVSFSGGLGNQLFQYSLVSAFKSKGKHAVLDISYYTENTGVMDFQLADAFYISDRVIQNCRFDGEFFRNLTMSPESKYYTIYSEPTIFEENEKRADLSLLSISGGILKGTFQSSAFYEIARNNGNGSFPFREVELPIIRQFDELAAEHTVVSVHMRRGDYLTERNQRIYGKICTEKYYRDAMNYFRNNYENVVFLLFSDDMDYFKGKYGQRDCVCIDRSVVEEYQDWYDMYLMSKCDHNIIANSTFSWWGAMLNEHPDKKVIAPKKWVNGCVYLDIYPREWITMEG
jgi:hypothetical protein